MRKTSFLIPALIALIGLLSLLPCPVAAQAEDEEPIAPSDTTFNRIWLSDEGVTAVDVEGYDWYYDFELGTFVIGVPELDPAAAEFDELDALSTDDLPVEERCTEERTIKPSMRSLLIGYDEYVDGNIVAYGRVTVKGWVRGDVRSMNQRVLVTSSGQVDGDIEAPEIIVKRGGVVLGDQIEADAPLEFTKIKETFSVDGIIIVIVFTVFFLFSGFIIVTLMPNKLSNFEHCFSHYRTKTWVTGFLMLLLMPVLVTVVTITIVGIVVVPMIPMAYIAAIVMGVTAFGATIGRVISKRYLNGEKSSVIRFFIGLVAVMAIWFFDALLLGSTSDVAGGLGIALLVVAIIISTYPICSGIGAALLTRFGFRRYISWREQHPAEGGAPAPAPPPIPTAPPISPNVDHGPAPDETSPEPPRSS